MTTQSPPTTGIDTEVKDSWLPMVVIGMGQVQMSLNINALPVSIGNIVNEFDTAPTTVGSAIVAYSLAVAGFVMLGGKLGQKFGSLRIFQIATVLLMIAMIIMTFSSSAEIMIVAQLIAGLAAAAIVPTLVVLIANNYRGKQQSAALGILGAVQAITTVTAFFLAGALGTWIGWRWAFGIVIPFTAVVLLLSFRLKPVPKIPNVKIDWVGVVLAAVAIIFISVGFSNLNSWGLLLAKAAAPLAPLGLSPAPILIVLGVIGVQLFIAWAQRRQAAQQTPLLSLEVIDSSQEQAAVFSMMSIVILGNALTFLVPLYIQMVQGRNSFDTSVAMIPYQLAVFAAAISIVRVFDRLSPRQIARKAFMLVSVGMVVLAIVMNNEWGTLPVICGLILVGLGQGSLVTLLFNVLVTASPKELAADVGALRGTVNNLAAGVGTALAGALVVGILSLAIQRGVVDHPTIPPELIQQVNLDEITFVSNDRLESSLANTTATPEQVAEAVTINAAARLRALKLSFFTLAALALLVIVPSRRLPGYVPGEVPSVPEE
ncbi:MAG: MFS transporter [Nodosilinea sp.]|jgi:MFS family permease